MATSTHSSVARPAVAAAVLLAAPAVALAQPSAALRGRPLAIEDYYRVRTVEQPEISPDGRWVAYRVTKRVEATNGETSELFIVPSDASTPPRRVPADSAALGTGTWAEDNRYCFMVGRARHSVQPASGTAIPDTTPACGTALEVRGRRGREANGLTVYESDPRKAARVRDVAAADRSVAYASDFEKRHEERFTGVQFDWLDFQRDGQPFPVPNRVDPGLSPPREIYLVPNGGRADRQLTHLDGQPGDLQWDREGAHLLFTADSAFRDERRYGARQIYTVSLDGTVRRLTPDDDVTHTNARYSPDGRWILYTRQLSTDAVIRQKLDHGGATDLAVIPATGGPERILTADWDYLPSGAVWSSDGRWIYFTGGVGGAIHLFRVSPDGGPVEQITKGERRITSLSFDRDFRRIAYTVGLIEAPPELYSANIDGSDERRLTRVNEALASEVAFSRAERLRFRSADGTPIEGWLLFPYGYQPTGGPYPLVVSSHGGPHSADGYAFDFKKQYFAANGYFVLQVNFRSSTGYGEQFLWATWGAWGTKDGQDVMAGVDHVLGRFPIDRHRVATIGHSYGGFMTNWLITQYPDRFAAAIPGAGIVNWMSDYGTADIARTKETEFYGTPWDDRAREIMIRQSPLTYAGRVRTPTLFINGEVDQRVPYSEAEQMYVALKKNGVPAKVIQYAGVPHSISGSWNQVHRMLNELRWLDRYLKPAKVS